MSPIAVPSAEGRVFLFERPRFLRLRARLGGELLGRLLARATDVRPVVHVKTGRTLLLFASRSGRRRFWIFGRAAPGGVEVLGIRELEPTGASPCSARREKRS